MATPNFSAFSVLESDLDTPIVEDLAPPLVKTIDSLDGLSTPAPTVSAQDGFVIVDPTEPTPSNPPINGKDGPDNLVGDNNIDVIYGRRGHDTIDGKGGNDQLFGEGGKDTIYGGRGNDTINGGNHNDLLIGNGGNDLIKGQGDEDQLRGHNGNDTLMGGNGNDVMVGGDGVDTLTGGKGKDTFIITFSFEQSDLDITENEDGTQTVRIPITDHTVHIITDFEFSKDQLFRAQPGSSQPNPYPDLLPTNYTHDLVYDASIILGIPTAEESFTT